MALRSLGDGHILSIIFIIICAFLFNLAPFFVSGVPLGQQILSDAEGHIAAWQMALNSKVFSSDLILIKSMQALPAGQIASASILVLVPKYFKVDIFLWSVIVSFVTLFTFVIGIYFLVFVTLKDRLAACLISFFCIVPIHALGGSTFGFQALGYLPRDLALAVIVLILSLYFRAVYRENSRLMLLVFFILGLLANFYVSFVANIVLTLIFAEIIRLKKIRLNLILCGIVFILGALPTLVEFFAKDSHVAAVDLNLMRSYYRYLMATPFPEALRQYLRRFIIYAISLPLIYFFIIRKSKKSDQLLIWPWISLALASFILSVIGVYIETTTIYTKYLISRASLWFMLSSMVICFYGIRLFMKRIVVAKERIFTILVVSFIFLVQSNAPSIYKFLKASHNTASQKKEFHIAVAQLKKLTSEDEIILVPSSEFDDLAATVRVYSERGIYVCYKYGGVSIMDGALAREWKDRYQKLERVFTGANINSLLEFMQKENIRWAFVPENYLRDNGAISDSHIIAKVGRYCIIKR